MGTGAEALDATGSLVLATGAADDFTTGLDSMADAWGRGGCDVDVGVDEQAANASHTNGDIAFRGSGLMRGIVNAVGRAKQSFLPGQAILTSRRSSERVAPRWRT